MIYRRHDAGSARIHPPSTALTFFTLRIPSLPTPFNPRARTARYASTQMYRHTQKRNHACATRETDARAVRRCLAEGRVVALLIAVDRCMMRRGYTDYSRDYGKDEISCKATDHADLPPRCLLSMYY